MSKIRYAAPIGPTWIAAGATYSTSTTLTQISPTPDLNFLGNELALEAGDRLRVRAGGRYSTTGAPTLNLGVYYGGTGGVALATTGAVTMGTTVTNLPWYLEVDIHIRLIGTSGTAVAIGKLVYSLTATTGSGIACVGSVPATIDTTVAKTLVCGATWGTNSASNTMACEVFTVERIN